MKKILSILFIALFLSATATATKTFDETISNLIQTEEVEPDIMPYCGPNDITCTPQIDIVFVIDSTGSMYDEIRSVKEELTNIIDNVNQGYPRPDVKIGVVTYRDYEPQEQDYITRELELTSSTSNAIRFIRNLNANGGGDYEEAVEAGLKEAINDMSWRKSSQKVIILVGDAPARDNPNKENHGNTPEYYSSYNWKDAVQDAQDKNIRIYTASGSGMNSEGISQWKTIAKKTGGRYISLIYERRVIKDYYEERDIPKEYAVEARASRDYDAVTDSVITNNLGIFTKASVMQVAEEAGVEYGGSLDEITGDLINVPEEQTNLKNFFEKIFQSIKFW